MGTVIDFRNRQVIGVQDNENPKNLGSVPNHRGDNSLRNIGRDDNPPSEYLDQLIYEDREDFDNLFLVVKIFRGLSSKLEGGLKFNYPSEYILLKESYLNLLEYCGRSDIFIEVYENSMFRTLREMDYHSIQELYDEEIINEGDEFLSNFLQCLQTTLNVLYLNIPEIFEGKTLEEYFDIEVKITL